MRKWIWKALDEVVNKKVYSNLYLRNHLQEVDEKDRALATRIFYGTIQNYRYCKECWSKYVKNKLHPLLRKYGSHHDRHTFLRCSRSAHPGFSVGR